MHILKRILSTLYIPALMILGTVVGLIVGGIFMAEGIVPWWSKYEVDPKDLNIQEIMLANFYYDYRTRESKDTIYVKTSNDQIYSFSKETESWQLIEPYPDDSIEKLAFSYDGVIAITNQGKTLLLKDNHWEHQINNDEYPPLIESTPCSENWLSPPVWRPIVDNEGGVVEHALAAETFCIVLLENGRLQSWYHQLNVFTGLLTIGVFSVLGFVGGGITSFFVRKRLTAKKNEVGEENENYDD